MRMRSFATRRAPCLVSKSPQPSPAIALHLVPRSPNRHCQNTRILPVNAAANPQCDAPKRLARRRRNCLDTCLQARAAGCILYLRNLHRRLISGQMERAVSRFVRAQEIEYFASGPTPTWAAIETKSARVSPSINPRARRSFPGRAPDLSASSCASGTGCPSRRIRNPAASKSATVPPQFSAASGKSVVQLDRIESLPAVAKHLRGRPALWIEGTHPVLVMPERCANAISAIHHSF